MSKSNFDFKASVRVTTLEPVVLSGLQIIDGVQLRSGDRVLVRFNDAKNGIYNVDTDVWRRSEDANNREKISTGMFVLVDLGTFAGLAFVLTTPDPIVLNVTLLDFDVFEVAGGSGAPVAAQYYVNAADATLTSEILLNAANPLARINGGTAHGYENYDADAPGIINGAITLTPSSSSTQIVVPGNYTILLPDPATCPGKTFRFYTDFGSGSVVIDALGTAGIIAGYPNMTLSTNGVFYEVHAVNYPGFPYWDHTGYPHRANVAGAAGTQFMVRSGAAEKLVTTGAVTATVGKLVLSGATTYSFITSQGTTGQPLLSLGANANPAFGTVGVIGGGTGSTVAGKTTLIGGTVTVANSLVSANTVIILTPQNSSGTPGEVRVSARTPGADFTITSSSGTDTSDVGYLFVEP